jgi:hypothetical protein
LKLHALSTLSVVGSGGSLTPALGPDTPLSPWQKFSKFSAQVYFDK